MRRFVLPASWIAIFALVWVLPSSGQFAAAQPGPAAADTHPFPRRVPAPTLDGGLEWFNTTRPLTLDDLRGKFVLVDFWTFCCINCMHVLPELQKLEHAYPNELVVVGVHSAKFEGEQDSQNIREAIMRYEIEHPVVNDANMAIWNRYGAQSWPTLVLIDPEGQSRVGRRRRAEIRGPEGTSRTRACRTTASKAYSNQARPTFIAKPEAADTPLRFPGKVLADAAGDRLFIADSNHNRIVVADLSGKLQTVIGPARSAAMTATSLRPHSIIRRAWCSSAMTCTSPIPKIICCAKSISRPSR